MKISPIAVALSVLSLTAGCRSVPSPTAPSPSRTRLSRDACLAKAVFDPAATSPYCVPLAEGGASLVSQAYCSESGRSHRGRFAYDFECDYGAEIRAARGGFVEFLGDAWPDSDPTSGHENRVVIRHADGTMAFYAHFQQDSLVVVSGESVRTGQLLGRCGSSGTPSTPHLHFEVFERAAFEWDRGLPVSFRNVEGPLDSRGGLGVGVTYGAGSCVVPE